MCDLQNPCFFGYVVLTWNSLSKGRRKRPVPDSWATGESISAYAPTESSEPLYPGSKALSVNSSGELALVGGDGGVVGVYSLPEKRVVQTLQANGPVTDAAWGGEKAVIASATGSVKVFENGDELANFNSHAGAATALAVHATADIVASVGVDKSYVLYDLQTNSVIAQVFTDACKYCYSTFGCRFQLTCCFLFSSSVRGLPSRRSPYCGWRCGWTGQDFQCHVWRLRSEL
jgi:hypothetical protein